MIHHRSGKMIRGRRQRSATPQGVRTKECASISRAKNAAEACERKPRMWSVCLIEGERAFGCSAQPDGSHQHGHLSHRRCALRPKPELRRVGRAPDLLRCRRRRCRRVGSARSPQSPNSQEQLDPGWSATARFWSIGTRDPQVSRPPKSHRRFRFHPKTCQLLPCRLP